MKLFQAKAIPLLTLITSLALLALACNGGGFKYLQPPSFIDQTIVLDAPDWVTGTETAPGEFTYDLSSIGLVRLRRFNDIEVSYVTPDSNDGLVYIYNFDTMGWDQVGFPFEGPALQFPTTHCQTLRDIYGTVEPYIDPDGMLVLWSEDAAPQEVRVLRLLETYEAARPIGEDNVNSFDGLTYDGAYFWASSNVTDRLYLIDTDGNVVSEFDSPGGYAFELAFDGDNIWLADGSDRILRMSLDGTVTGEFTVPTDYPGGLAWGDDSLWLAEYAGPDLRTFRIDPDASCAAGSAVIIDTFSTPGGGSNGLAWDGHHLLVLSDSLYVVNADGTVASSYALPVVGARGLAWDGQAVVMFSQGPDGVGNSGQKLNWFRLP